MTNVQENKTFLIGNYNELIEMLANGIETNGYDDSSRWTNTYFEDINLGNDYTKTTTISYTKHDDSYTKEYISDITITQKKYLFFDGLNRTIDVRLFEDDIIKFFVKNHNQSSNHRLFTKYKRWYNRQGRASHAGTWYHHKHLNNRKKIRTLDSMFKNDEEFKDYHFKRLEDTENPYPCWYDDACRRVEGNWKSQYKVNKQHNIHNGGKTDRSIRKNNIEDFTYDEIDKMLYEDFINNKNGLN